MAERLIQVNQSQLANLEKTLKAYPRGIAKVMSRAVNKVATSSRQDIAVEVRKRLSIKAGELKRRNLTLKKASYGRQSAVIGIKSARISLAKLSARQTKKGVTYKIGKTGPRKRADRAFITTMKSGHKGVFKRISAMKGEVNKERSRWFMEPWSPTFDQSKSNRLPITELKGPSVPQVFQDIASFAKAVHERKIATNLTREIAKQVELLLEGKTA
jgi:hypothetical protein